MKISTQCSTALNRDLLQSELPLKSSNNKSREGISTMQQAIKNSHFKKDAAIQRLAKVVKIFAAPQGNKLKYSEKLNKALDNIAEFNAAEATTVEDLEVLR